MAWKADTQLVQTHRPGNPSGGERSMFIVALNNLAGFSRYTSGPFAAQFGTQCPTVQLIATTEQKEQLVQFSLSENENLGSTITKT